MQKKSLLDDIYQCLRGRQRGTPTQELAETFFRFKNAGTGPAQKTVETILGSDKRFTRTGTGLWSIRAAYCLQSVSWRAVYLLTSPTGRNSDTIYHISVWAPFDSVPLLMSGWLTAPSSLPYMEQEILDGSPDTIPVHNSEFIEKLISCLDDNPVLFLSHSQQQLLENHCACFHEPLTDNVLLISQLFKAVSIPFPRRITLEKLYETLFHKSPVLGCADSYGAAFNECCRESVERLQNEGINDMEHLDSIIRKTSISTDWPHLQWEYKDAALLPKRPGVYGFMDEKRTYLYIGKAGILRNRLSQYFRSTEESPVKINRLREEAHFLTIYECGSELESFLLEFRLIRKYKPVLNNQININERKGFFSPIQDSIVLLPHKDPEKVMSFWFRKDQKILMKPLRISFEGEDELIHEINRFFFSPRLPAEHNDFPEQEIAFRWIKKHRDSLTILPVYAMENDTAVIDALRQALPSFKTPVALERNGPSP